MNDQDIASKFGIPMKTFSIWVKNKEIFSAALWKGINVKWQKPKTGNYAMVDTTLIKWFLFLGMRTQNFPLSAFIIQNKVAEFTKVISIETFKALYTWLQEQKRCNIQNYVLRIGYCSTGKTFIIWKHLQNR